MYFFMRGKPMNSFVRCTLVALVVGGFAGAASGAQAPDRAPADVILKELDETTLPKFDAAKRSDQEYIRQYIADRQKAMEKRGALIRKLYKAAPDHEKLPNLLQERWSTLPQFG